MHLFKSIQYELSGQEIEKNIVSGSSYYDVGFVKYPDDFSKSQILNQFWYKDTSTQPNLQNTGWNIRKQYVISNFDPKGTFSSFVRTMIR